VILTAPGEEGQVDDGSGPMLREPKSGKYRRPRLFVLTLGYSRKAVRLLGFRSSTHIWAELHEKAFRRLGGVPRLLVLDNLREGVLQQGKMSRDLSFQLLFHPSVMEKTPQLRKKPSETDHGWKSSSRSRSTRPAILRQRSVSWLRALSPAFVIE
jgi:hypothetical protein